MKVELLKGKKATGKMIRSGRDIYNLMLDESKADREYFWVLHLNSSFYVIEKELVGIGSLCYVNVEPRECFKKAIINSAYSIILIHNHPDGYATPSYSDEKCCEQYVRLGELLGIKVTDFVIIGRYGYYSYHNHIRGKQDYFGQRELQIEQAAVCIECEQWISNDKVVQDEDLIYCAYCWEVLFGRERDDWIP